MTARAPRAIQPNARSARGGRKERADEPIELAGEAAGAVRRTRVCGLGFARRRRRGAVRNGSAGGVAPTELRRVAQPVRRVGRGAPFAPDDLNRVVGAIAEADMQPLRTHVIDTCADAGRAAGRGRGDKPADGPKVGGTGEIKRPPPRDKLKVGGVSAIVTVRADSLACRSRLAAGGDADGIDARFVRGREQHLPQRGADRHVPDLGGGQRRFVDYRHFGGPP
jgi:hypothetical protein